MGALKRYRSLGGGDEITKFTEVGQSLEGIWRGTKRGKYENGIIETPDGIRHLFSLSTMLRDLLKVPEGQGVKITYLGKRISKAGNEYGAYQILVEDDAEPDSSEDDRVPF